MILLPLFIIITLNYQNISHKCNWFLIASKKEYLNNLSNRKNYRYWQIPIFYPISKFAQKRFFYILVHQMQYEKSLHNVLQNLLSHQNLAIRSQALFSYSKLLSGDQWHKFWPSHGLLNFCLHKFSDNGYDTSILKFWLDWQDTNKKIRYSIISKMAYPTTVLIITYISALQIVSDIECLFYLFASNLLIFIIIFWYIRACTNKIVALKKIEFLAMHLTDWQTFFDYIIKFNISKNKNLQKKLMQDSNPITVLHKIKNLKPICNTITHNLTANSSPVQLASNAKVAFNKLSAKLQNSIIPITQLLTLFCFGQIGYLGINIFSDITINQSLMYV